MIVSNSRKFIFVHINKTAGTSIADALYPQLAWNDIVLGSTPLGTALDVPYRARFGLSKHSTAREIRAVVGESVWSEYRSFAVLRDPVDRALSLYHYLKRIQARKFEIRGFLRNLLRKGGQDWVAIQVLRETASFSDFIRHPRLRFDPGFAAQHGFVTDEAGEVIVDTLLRFETIEAEFPRLCRDLGMPGVALGHKNRSHGPQGAISERDIAFLRDHFVEDYALLESLGPGRQKAGDRRASSG